jgi:hypothetical protein
MSDLSRRKSSQARGPAAIGAVPLAAPALAAAKPGKGGRQTSSEAIVKLFSKLPGTGGVEDPRPPANGDRGLLIEHNPSQQMFVLGDQDVRAARGAAPGRLTDILEKIGENPAHPDRVVQLPLTRASGTSTASCSTHRT